MSGGLPQFTAQHDRRADFLISLACVNLAPVIDQRVLNNHAFREEERETGAFFQKGKNAEFLAETAMVALLGFFDACQMLVKFALLGERRAVDTRKHLVLFIAAPISTGAGGEFDCF